MLLESYERSSVVDGGGGVVCHELFDIELESMLCSWSVALWYEGARGGTKPAWHGMVFVGSLVSSKNVCSMFLSVVGVSVAVVLVGAPIPLLKPSKLANCNEKKMEIKLVTCYI